MSGLRCSKWMPMKWHWQPERRLGMRCLTLMPMERQCMAAREKAALFKVDAHEVALAAREEAGSALFNADAQGVAGHGSPWEGCVAAQKAKLVGGGTLQGSRDTLDNQRIKWFVDKKAVVSSSRAGSRIRGLNAIAYLVTNGRWAPGGSI